ncbi:hypothetical protein PMLGA01_030016600, partial [Plasmodium malariae]
VNIIDRGESITHKSEDKIDHNENIIDSKENVVEERVGKNYEFIFSHKIQDLEWLASDTNDKGWLAIGDRWELCKRDLKWLCVKTNNRSWLLYRHLWENSSNDLKYISVLFDDKKWLQLYNVWKFVPLSIKFKAISCKDPSICKPSLSEFILNDDDIYKNSILELTSDILKMPSLRSEYLKCHLNDKSSKYLWGNDKNTAYMDKTWTSGNDFLSSYANNNRKENNLKQSVETYNMCESVFKSIRYEQRTEKGSGDCNYRGYCSGDSNANGNDDNDLTDKFVNAKNDEKGRGRITSIVEKHHLKNVLTNMSKSFLKNQKKEDVVPIK